MTDEQILSLVEQYFVELNPFLGITPKEYAGDTEAFLKFAEKMYNKGKYDGYNIGYGDGCYEATGGNW